MAGPQKVRMAQQKPCPARLLGIWEGFAWPGLAQPFLAGAPGLAPSGWQPSFLSLGNQGSLYSDTQQLLPADSSWRQDTCRGHPAKKRVLLTGHPAAQKSTSLRRLPESWPQRLSHCSVHWVPKYP